MVVYGGENNSFGKQWSTPFGLKIGWEKLGHMVDAYQMNPASCNLSELEKNIKRYDFVWVGWPWISESLDDEIKRLKEKYSAKIILHLDDEPQTYGQGHKRLLYCYGAHTPDLRCYRMYRSQSKNVHWINHWGDEHMFYYNPEINRQNICITTCGHKQSTEYLRSALGNKFIQERIPTDQNNLFYNKGTVCFQFARFDEITRRIMEAGGCKLAVVTNRISEDTGIYNLFKDGVDVMYYDSVESAQKKINMLLEDDYLRNSLAENLYNKVNSKYRTAIACEQIINIANGYNDVTFKLD